jgi:hypothetical protein
VTVVKLLCPANSVSGVRHEGLLSFSAAHRLAVGQPEGGCSPLYGVAMNVRGLVSDVEHEPELKAGIGAGGPDVGVCCLGYGLLQVWVLVGVEYTPDFVEIRSVSFTPPFAHLLLSTGFLNERERHSARRGLVMLQRNSLPMLAGQEVEVVGFSQHALGQDADHPALRLSPGCPPRCLALWLLHDSTSVAARVNSPGSSTGSAPNRPYI